MKSLQNAGISRKDLDILSEQISEEVIKFLPWKSFVVTERAREVAAYVIQSNVRRKIRELFGKPLPPINMRSPRAAKRS